MPWTFNAQVRAVALYYHDSLPPLLVFRTIVQQMRDFCVEKRTVYLFGQRARATPSVQKTSTVRKEPLAVFHTTAASPSRFAGRARITRWTANAQVPHLVVFF